MCPVRRIQLQVVDAVVVNDPVPMVHNFEGVEYPAKVGFHHEPVFPHVSKLICVRVVGEPCQHVPGFVLGAATVPEMVAFGAWPRWEPLDPVADHPAPRPFSFVTELSSDLSC